jgi:hypothetical protein
MDLDEAWRRALEQAWQSFLAGTTPVGAGGPVAGLTRR